MSSSTPPPSARKESVEASTKAGSVSTPSAKAASVTPVREQVVAEAQRAAPIVAPSAARPAPLEAPTAPPPVSTQTVDEPELAITTAPATSTSSGTPAPSARKESVEASSKSGVVSTPSAKATSVISAREQVVAEADRPTPIIGPPPTRPAQSQAPAATTPPSVAMRTVDEPEWAISSPLVTSPVTSMSSDTPASSARKETPEASPKPGVVVSTPSSKPTPVTPVSERAVAEADRAKSDKGTSAPLRLHDADALSPIMTPPAKRPTPPETPAPTTPPPLSIQTADRPGLTILTGPVVFVPSRAPAAPLRDEAGDPRPSASSAPSSKPTPASPTPEAAIGPERVQPEKEAPESRQVEIPKPVSTVPTPPAPSLAQERQVAAAPPIATAPPAVASPEAGASRGVDGPAPPAASPFGLGGRLMVSLDRPRSKVTDEATISVSGRIQGRAASDVLLRINDGVQEVPIDRRSFTASVPLVPGENRITAVVVGTDGVEVEDSITIEYVARVAAAAIALASPRDGFVLGPDDPPALVVDGRVENRALTTVWVLANQRAVAIPVRDGRFVGVVPMLEPRVDLWVESRLSDGTVERSDPVTVSAQNRGQFGLLMLDWVNGAPSAPVEVRATRRDAPGDIDRIAAPVSLRSVGQASGNAAPEAIYIKNLKPGVYTFTVRVAGAVSATRVRPTVYFSSTSGRMSERALKGVEVDGKAAVVVARILLPQGILWDDEGWTGKSESADTITKFRFPEGITWIERKADLR